jgi:23S rRNA pseudouridine1911/1915/1917 synthase
MAQGKKKAGPKGKAAGEAAAGREKARNPAPEDAGLRRRYEGQVDLGFGQPGCPASGGERADRYVAEALGLLSRSQLKARGATITVDGKAAKLSALLKGGERLVVEWLAEPPSDLVPEDLPLSVLYEDGRVIVLDKAQGMVTHPGHGNRRGTLANALLWRLGCGQPAASQGLPARAGIVHRLDKDTSGVIIAAKDAEAQAYLASQFKERTTRKEYLAITKGIPEPPSGRLDNHLGRDRRDRKRFAVVDGVEGKQAVTEYRVLARYGSYALVSMRPRTGRTHQLRVHLASLGTPIVGDPIYGKPDRDLPGASLMLHAYRLRILLPGQEEASLFKAPLPTRFRRLLGLLERRYGKTPP